MKSFEDNNIKWEREGEDIPQYLVGNKNDLKIKIE